MGARMSGCKGKREGKDNVKTKQRAVMPTTLIRHKVK